MKRLALIIALTVFSTSAFGEGAYQNEAELSLVREVSVHVKDDVVDGCLANPNALKVEAELILRRSGITIIEGWRKGMHLLLVSAQGWEIKTTGQTPFGACAVTIDLDLSRSVTAPEGHSGFIIAYENAGLFIGYTKPEMQEALRNIISEIVSDLANEILKARGN